MKEIKIFTIPEVIDWLKLKRNQGKTFTWINDPACMFSLFARYRMKKHPMAICHAYGYIYKQCSVRHGPIAKVPFHNKFWEKIYGGKVTTAKAIKILTTMAKNEGI